MSNIDNKAAELAANFQVEELEPRLENAWGEVIPEQPYPDPTPCPDYDC